MVGKRALVAGVAACVAAVAVLPACGEDRPEPPKAKVKLDLSAPADSSTVTGETVEIRGKVVPRLSDVSVRGQRVTVSGGEFRTEIDLAEGANVIDVFASAPDRTPEVTAVRVVRQAVVPVPEVRGASRDEAVARIREAGLVPRVSDAGSVLDDFLPGGESVCLSDPDAGTEVLKGSTVRVVVAEIC